MLNQSIPVVTIDGPAGVGKGTIAQLLAQRLSFHLLDSGSIYRGLALAAVNAGIAFDDEVALSTLAAALDWQTLVQPSGNSIYLLAGRDVTVDIRSETCADGASKVAVLPAVRASLVVKQRTFREVPGLVAEGRDMGTAVFPDAEVKFFLTAPLHVRAKRRYKQLQVMGKSVSIAEVMDDMLTRDQRDISRSSSPLAPASGAITVDTGAMSLDSTRDMVLATVDSLL